MELSKLALPDPQGFENPQQLIQYLLLIREVIYAQNKKIAELETLIKTHHP